MTIYKFLIKSYLFHLGLQLSYTKKFSLLLRWRQRLYNQVPFWIVKEIIIFENIAVVELSYIKYIYLFCL